MFLKVAFAFAITIPLSALGAVSDDCYDYLYSLPEISPISEKIAVPDVTKASFKQLSNQEKPSPQDKEIIEKLANGLKVCFDLEMEYLPKNIHPSIRKAIEDNYTNRSSSLIDLYNEKITYGEYIKRRQASVTTYRREIDTANNEIDEINAQASQAEAAQQREAWGRIFGNISEAIKNSRPKPSINCTSTEFGGRVTTTCR